ncbi:MAG: 50S ribosomal protein L9 [Actinobacteria bacterium]|nr:50S ribosomal protein L9 [Actinomycetota bacterium]
MKVVLRRDLESVGHRGDIVDVAGGFARNYLLPKDLAIVATPGIKDQAAAMRRSRDLREARDRDAAVGKAQVLAGAAIAIKARAGTGGKLFGSVSAAEIVGAVAEQTSTTLRRSDIVLEDPIKALGTFEVHLKLHHDVETVLIVEVAPES